MDCIHTVSSALRRSGMIITASAAEMLNRRTPPHGIRTILGHLPSVQHQPDLWLRGSADTSNDALDMAPKAESVTRRKRLTSDALEGGEVPPPSRAPSLRPATVSLAASAGLNGICNRQ